MEFDVSPGALINAGGALLFLLAGIAILAVARQTRLGLRLGAFAAAFGLAYVVENLVDYDVDPVSAAVLLVPASAAAVCLGFLIAEVVRELPRPARSKVGVVAAGMGLTVVVALVVLFGRQLDDPGLISKVGANSVGAFPLTFFVQPFLLVLLAAGAQVPSGGPLQIYRGRLLLGLSAGLFAVNIGMVSAASNSPDGSWRGPAIDGVGLLIGALVVYTAWLVLRGRPAGAEPFARRAFFAMVVVGVAGCIQQAFPEGTSTIGPYGIIRSLGAVLLVLAVVKYDVLGVPLPRLMVRRGALAGGALAMLFIVAQVAQNFFSAQYGLLMGGILAGGFVFAASPIQRAIERSGERAKPTAAAPGSAVVAYKAAMRAAMRDGTLTRREERHLAEVAMALGISPVQALDLRDEVEREA